MSNKTSSVEQLAELIRFTNKEVYAELFEQIEQIKAMHKEEIIKAFKNGDNNGTFDTINAEQYYNEIFKTKEK